MFHKRCRLSKENQHAFDPNFLSHCSLFLHFTRTTFHFYVASIHNLKAFYVLIISWYSENFTPHFPQYYYSPFFVKKRNFRAPNVATKKNYFTLCEFNIFLFFSAEKGILKFEIFSAEVLNIFSET